MKVGWLRKLIVSAQSKVQSIFKHAVEREFPQLLIELSDDDGLPLSILQKQSSSLRLFNMYGVLSTMREDYGIRTNPELAQELDSIIKQIQLEFPGIKNGYNYEQEDLSPILGTNPKIP